jgi:hypothetical protein
MRILIFIFVFLSFVDLFLTIEGSKEGIFAEANPLFKGLLDRGKYTIVSWIKILITLAISLLMYFTNGQWYGRGLIYFGVIAQFYIIYNQWKYRKIYYEELNKSR